MKWPPHAVKITIHHQVTINNCTILNYIKCQMLMTLSVTMYLPLVDQLINLSGFPLYISFQARYKAMSSCIRKERREKTEEIDYFCTL